ncbi:MAG: galactose-1-phosphate uridylyltransferase [Planctomycetia bacterium]|nr:galactose-1-phosphate uridylyltransferase [Planctomycetia bacterium]
MAEVRRDPIVGRSVIIAPERAGRPQEFVDKPLVSRETYCPFCERNEAETPGEIAAIRNLGTSANDPGWQVRVIPNKYPALNGLSSADLEAADDSPPIAAAESDRFCSSQPAIGRHEVIIESPHHLLRTGSLTESQLADVLRVYRDRMRAHRAAGRLRYVQIFKNVGEAAGASIEHLHSQLMALDFVPGAIVDELTGSREYFSRTGSCIFCDLIERESTADVRVVETTAEFTAICPYASRFPYEVWLLPRRHSQRFEDADDQLLTAAAAGLLRVLKGVEKLLDSVGSGSTGYNYVLHSAPFDSSEADHYHWHIEVIPRAVKQAGFEWATGVHINPVPPEEAAATLKRLI